MRSALVLASSFVFIAGCSSKDGFSVDGGVDSPFGPSFGDASSDGGGCTNLCLKQQSCGGSATTSVSGTVYDPAGQTPLYNVAVYVPNAPLDPINHGATCDQCGSTLSGSPLVATLTDDAGHFKLDNVPVDSNVPLVFQVGKWRRRITVATVNACVDNPITDKNQTRLATRPAETSPDDDIPFIAVSTGIADTLECLPLMIGIDPAQFTAAGGTGRVNLYTGFLGSTLSGGTPAAASLWSSEATLKQYDIVMLSCEGGTPDTHLETLTGTPLQNMYDYGNAGGRIFATHFHYYWIESGPAPWPTTATFDHASDPQPQSGFPVLIDQTFAKGQAFAQWMLNVGGSTTLGQFSLDQPRHDVDAVNGLPTTNPAAIRWVYATSPSMDEYYSFNTPVAVPSTQQCGKVVFSDLHVGAGNSPSGIFPLNCTQGSMLTPQEKALEFLLFDLSSCIQNDTEPPPPPVN